MLRLLLSLVTLVTLGVAATPALAQTTLYPTIPGTSLRDLSKPGYTIQSGPSGHTDLYPTLPGTNLRDFRRPGYSIDPQGEVVPTIPGTDLRDFSRPGFQLGR